MFKLAVLAAILAVASAAPGGATGLVFSHGLGPIHAPAVIAAPVHAAPAHVYAAPVAHVQPIAPVVHSPPVITTTFLAGHGHASYGHGYGLHG